MKKLLAMLLALVMLLSALPLAGAAFKDENVIDKEYARAVSEMSAQGIINGFSDGSFGPDKTLTRAQAAKIICVMVEGAEKANALTKTETGFADVPATHWAAKFVAYCVDKGIVAGVGDGKFDPDGQLTFAAFAKMLLVAIGTDGAGFTGADWLKNVQTAAESTLLLYNMGDKLTTDSLERQKAAQLAFNAKVQAEANADKAKGDSRTMPVEIPETIKLFVIGNSYGNDSAVAYLWNILKDIGVKNVTVGTLYFGSCRLRQHTDHFMMNKPVYRYYKNTSGKVVTKTKTTFDASLADEKWTHVMMLSGESHPGGFEPIRWQDYVIAHVRKTQPDAYIGFDMTWAFRSDGKHSKAMQKNLNTNFGGDSMKMWESVVATTKKYVETEPRFKFIARCGTAVMNAHTSFLGNSIYRDGTSHLNKGVGRYTAAMMVANALTGVTPDQIKYVPNLTKEAPAGIAADTPGLQETLEKVAKESVANAIAKPHEITQSQYKTAP